MVLIFYSFSCKDTVLPDSRIQLSRDGGENLEGVFWGANLVIPLSLLKEHTLSDHQLPFSIRYDRGGVISSPFAGGNTLLNLFCAKKRKFLKKSLDKKFLAVILYES